MKNAIALCVFVMLGCVSGCAYVKQETLAARAVAHVVYECEKGYRIVATYYSLADGSLDFVKVRLHDGRERTLPRVLSASGVRYTDDRDLVSWTKGESAFAETRYEKGHWQVLYHKCHAILKTK